MTGKYGSLSALATPVIRNRIGMASSAPTTAMGTTGHAGPHGDLDEPAPAEPAEPVAVGVRLRRGLGPLREHQGQLLLVVEDPVGVVGVGGHPSGAGPHGADPREACGRSSRPARRRVDRARSRCRA